MSNYLLSILTATMFAAQAPQAPQPTVPKQAAQPTVTKKTADPPITLTGCINRDATTPGSYTFSEAKTGVKYRVMGLDVQKEPGKQGELVVGSGTRRVTIRGGLVPSPNVAAQAGAIDSSKLAIASLPGGANSGTGNVQLPEFQATRVQAATGSCP